jgi:hypothetical protein
VTSDLARDRAAEAVDLAVIVTPHLPVDMSDS